MGKNDVMFLMEDFDPKELETIFAAEAKKYVKQTYAEEAIEKVEQEYKNMGTNNESRNDEKTRLNKKLAELTTRLRKIKNPKNVRVAAGASSSMASKRMTIKTEIEQIKDRLYEIQVEEKGSSMDSVADGAGKSVADAVVKDIKIGSERH